MISDFRSYVSDMTYVNLVFPIGWLIREIVYRTGLLLLIPLTNLKLDWINFGTVKILYMILEHSCREPEVVVKCCVKNFNSLAYCKVISRCGHRGFGLRSSTPSTLRLRLRIRKLSLGHSPATTFHISFSFCQNSKIGNAFLTYEVGCAQVKVYSIWFVLIVGFRLNTREW